MKKKNIHFRNALILVVGDLILDCYWYNKNYNILSNESIPILPIQKIQKQAGGAANVAKNIAEIGGFSKIIGVIGSDYEGLTLKKLLHHSRINCDFITIQKHKTITKIRVLIQKKKFIRLDFQEKYNFTKNHLLKNKIIHALPKFKVLVLSDYGKGTLIDIKKIIYLAKKISIPVLIDPKGINFKKYSGASLLTPNLLEFEKIVGKCYKESQILEKGVKLLLDLNLSALLVTRAQKGMTLFQRKKNPIHFPVISKTAHDVTGAGDTVIAIIAASLATGYSLEEACFHANVGASIVIKKTGTETLTIRELNNILNL